MENGFITWEALIKFTSFVPLVYMVVEFTKELKWFKVIPTRYYSAIVSFVLMIATNLHGKTFSSWDLVTYALSAMMISMGAGGLANFNQKKIQ